jgi:hexokinase
LTEQINVFLQKHAISADSISTSAVLNDFKAEMNKGLSGEPSSLKMIPTFITPRNNLPCNESVIVIDAGGTNLRTALVHFDNNSTPEIEQINRHWMPGTSGLLTAAEFYAALKEYLAPIISKSNRIGFCFSYPAEITPERDGRLIHWTKDIQVPELEGRLVGAGLLAALGPDGADKKLTLLNDTIATLLAGKAQSSEESSYIGLILGTGTNMAYIEKNNNITKLDIPDGQQAINVESGGFALAPACDFDRKLDADTINPGEYLFEKMIAGLYRGRLILLALQAAANEMLLSEICAKQILNLTGLEAFQVDQFMRSNNESPLYSCSPNDKDKNTIRDIINAIYDRTAKLTALNISAAVLKNPPAPGQSTCINIDGSTYYKSFGFQNMTEKYIAEILGQNNINYKLMHVDEAPIIGAAIGGIIN